MAIREIVAGVFVVGAGLWWFSPAHDVSEPDMITTASVAKPLVKEFTVSNMASRTACVIARGDMTTKRSRSVTTETDCASVWPGLARVKNWTDNGDGTVDLTDSSGEQVLTLGFGDGVGYEALEPSDASIALTAIN